MAMKFSRRAMLAGLAGVPIANLARPAYAQAGFETVSLTTSGGRKVSGVVALPAKVPAPTLLLIHGSGGLIDVYKSFATDFARDGFFAAALDLYDGQTVGDEATRSRLQNSVRSDPAKALETISTWLAWLKADSRSTGKIGVIGWSFGAPWALEASMATPVDATVVYVGLAFPGATRLAALKGPVLAHLAERNPDISKDAFTSFENTMAEAGKSVQVHWYPTDHYFPFSDRPTYNREQADAAWAYTVKFLRENLQ
jgi:carboxymethylenebutenolidase